MYATTGQCTSRKKRLETNKMPRMRCGLLGITTGSRGKGTGMQRTLHYVCFEKGSEIMAYRCKYDEHDEKEVICGNCLHHKPSWETGHLSGWHCDNFMADAYGCSTEYEDGEECPDFESKR